MTTAELPISQLELAPVETGERPQKQIAPFSSFKEQIESLKKTAETLVIKDVHDKAGMQIARATRLALRDVRLAISGRHKELKEDALDTCKRLDAGKREMLALIEPLELRLEEQEKFAERAEAKRIDDLHIARYAEINPFLDAPPMINLGLVSDDVWTKMLSDAKDLRAARLAREAKEREDAERLAAENKLRIDRTIEIAPLRQYARQLSADLGTMPEVQFSELMENLRSLKKQDDDAREAQRLENERLKLRADRERKLSLFTLAASVKRPEDLAALTSIDFVKLEAQMREAHGAEGKRLADIQAAQEAERQAEIDKAAAALKKAQDEAAANAKAAKAKTDAALAKAHEEAMTAQEERDRENARLAQLAEEQRQETSKLADELASQKKAKDDADKARVAKEKKDAAAPLMDKLKNYAEALNDIPIPDMPPEQGGLESKIRLNVRKLSDWIVQQAEAL